MVDFYLENIEELNGQPKRTIGDYAESNGILVPRRFDSLEEARASGLPIILRSEHIDEYVRRLNGKLVTGISGLLKSPDLNKFKWYLDEETIKKEVFKEPDCGHTQALQYCMWLGRKKEDLMQEISFSYWEKLEGYNRAITADSSIKGRYHITTNREGEKDDWLTNYVVFENGKIDKSYFKPLTENLIEGLGSLVELYETVRNLPRFDKNNCPVIEIQTVGKKNYFLQYNRTRDFEESRFTLERPPAKEEKESMFVRGGQLL